MWETIQAVWYFWFNLLGWWFLMVWFILGLGVIYLYTRYGGDSFT